MHALHNLTCIHYNISHHTRYMERYICTNNSTQCTKKMQNIPIDSYRFEQPSTTKQTILSLECIPMYTIYDKKQKMLHRVVNDFLCLTITMGQNACFFQHVRNISR